MTRCGICVYFGHTLINWRLHEDFTDSPEKDMIVLEVLKNSIDGYARFENG